MAIVERVSADSNKVIDPEVKLAIIAEIASEMDKVYPVGSIQITTANTNPGEYLPGTWVSFGTGRTLVGVDTSDSDFAASESTGGTKTVSLTTSQMPKHSHTLESIRTKNAWTADGTATGNWLSSDAYYWGSSEKYKDIQYEASIGSTGSGSAHNNLQPYITVYFWKRTA